MPVLQTHTILDKIVLRKKQEVEARLKKGERGTKEREKSQAPRDFIQALERGPGRAVIAEIKKASPSAGVLRADFNPLSIAKAYEENGARAVSVITDRDFFQGSIDYLAGVRKEISLPLLRKDFIIHPVQVEEAAEAGADAILLITRILDDELLQELYRKSLELGLTPLVEVHDQHDLERTLKLNPGPRLIGINNRNLADFSVRVERTLELLPMIPQGVKVVSESGLDSPETLDRLIEQGVHAFLIGTALMKAENPGAELRRFVFG